MPQTPQLVYLAFGAETYQREAVFSIVSALSHTLAGQPPTFAIQVFTDTPALYTRLPVTTHAIDPSWNGPHGYHFRIKHVVLQKVLEANDKAVLTRSSAVRPKNCSSASRLAVCYATPSAPPWLRPCP